MYLLIYTVLLLIVFFFSKMVENRWFTFATIFSGFWFFFAGLSSLGLFHIRKPSFLVHLYVIIFVSIVDLCIFLLKRIEFVIRGGPIDTTYKLEYRRIVMIQTLALLLSIPLLTQAVVLFIQFRDLSMIRNNFYSSLFDSYIVGVVFKDAPVGLLNALVIIWSIYGIGCKKYKHVIWSVVDCLFVTLINGGRGAILDLMVVLALLFIYQQGSSAILTRRNKRKIIVALLVMGGLMIAVSLNRSQNFLRSLYVYFSGSFALLDYVIDNAQMFDLNNHQYGYVSLSFLIEPIILIVKYLGWTDIKIPSWHFNNYCQKYYDIGTSYHSISINNNTTFFFCFLKDFGPGGIILAAFIFGFVISQLQKKVRYGDDKSLLFFLYFSTVLISGIMSYNKMLGTSFFFLLFAITFCCKKVRVGNINETEKNINHRSCL